MKIKLSKTQWEKIGEEAGWLKSVSYAIRPPPEPVKMCERCEEKPAQEIKDEKTGALLGYSDYCAECDERIDNGPFSRLLKQVGPEKATQIMKDLTQNKKDIPRYKGDIPSNFDESLPF